MCPSDPGGPSPTPPWDPHNPPLEASGSTPEDPQDHPETPQDHPEDHPSGLPITQGATPGSIRSPPWNHPYAPMCSTHISALPHILMAGYLVRRNQLRLSAGPGPMAIRSSSAGGVRAPGSPAACRGAVRVTRGFASHRRNRMVRVGAGNQANRPAPGTLYSFRSRGDDAALSRRAPQRSSPLAAVADALRPAARAASLRIRSHCGYGARPGHKARPISSLGYRLYYRNIKRDA